jgi:oxygen-independent coproporphyrinogen-3 oxidase
MAGIYIHIPFCKKKCNYCDFYTVVAPSLIPNIVDSICKELHIRKDYLKNEKIRTIYFGGGTPSILNTKQFQTIFNTIFSLFEVEDNAEITIEANPDDLTKNYLSSLTSLPFNRLSIGIQSFDDTDLKRINRRHSGQQAIEAVKNAQQAGFNNISIDLMYGLPLQSLAAWEQQVHQALALHVQHISAYGLTYEEGTILWKQREKGIVTTLEDETINAMHLLLVHKLQAYGFEAYEISNFSLLGYRSRHNTSYWNNHHYLGVGPSAHSFDGDSRQWNISSNSKYIAAVNEGTPFFEKEQLTENEKYNDFVMISLRTSEGLHLDTLEKKFGKKMKNYCFENLKKYIKSEYITLNNNTLRLTHKGIQLSNMIISESFKV